MRRLTFDPADTAAGLLFLVLGLFFGAQSLGLEMGTTLRMGPGYFPVVLSGLLTLLGLAVILGGLRSQGEPVGPWAWRGMLFILPAPILFGLTVRGAGFGPALFATTLLVCFATPLMKPWQAVVLATAVTVFASLVFVQGLGLPFRLLGSWFDPPVAG